MAVPAIAQQPEDPENDHRLGLWLDQAISIGLEGNRSLEFESHQRFDEGASDLYEYFFQGGVAFRCDRGSPYFLLQSVNRATGWETKHSVINNCV